MKDIVGLSVQTHEVVLVGQVPVVRFPQVYVVKAPPGFKRFSREFIYPPLFLEGLTKPLPFVRLPELGLFLLRSHCL